MYVLHWEKLDKDYITVSPLLYPRFSLDRLRKVLDGEKLDIGDFLNHCQHNERFVKQVTMSVGTNIGKKKQLANIINAVESRKILSREAKLEDFLKV